MQSNVPVQRLFPKRDLDPFSRFCTRVTAVFAMYYCWQAADFDFLSMSARQISVGLTMRVRLGLYYLKQALHIAAATVTPRT